MGTSDSIYNMDMYITPSSIIDDGKRLMVSKKSNIKSLSTVFDKMPPNIIAISYVKILVKDTSRIMLTSNKSTT